MGVLGEATEGVRLIREIREQWPADQSETTVGRPLEIIYDENAALRDRLKDCSGKIAAGTPLRWKILSFSGGFLSGLLIPVG